MNLFRGYCWEGLQKGRKPNFSFFLIFFTKPCAFAGLFYYVKVFQFAHHKKENFKINAINAPHKKGKAGAWADFSEYIKKEGQGKNEARQERKALATDQQAIQNHSPQLTNYEKL